MIEIFNAISNIAVEIEYQIFKKATDFLVKSDDEIHEAVYEHSSKIIEDALEYVKTVKGVMGKDKKFYCNVNEDGKYLISYVPVDSIDMLDVNYSLGSIFGIYQEKFQSTNMVGAAYITYGPTFQLVFATKQEGVMLFTYENGKFMQKESFSLNSKGNINSSAGNVSEWSKEHEMLIDSFFEDGYRLRCSDSLCLDTHQILFKKGGIYSNPATRSNPDGILETIFEAFPISFIIELVGGLAVDGRHRVLDITDDSLHRTTPLYFGSRTEIERVLERLN
jgi:fructose-1,6-bisphosphatase I